MTIRFWLPLGLLLLCASPLLADSGALIVRVADADGDSLANVEVKLQHETGLVPPRLLRTDGEGRARFAVLPARGGYVVSVTADDRSDRRTGVSIPAGGTRYVEMRLPAPSDGVAPVSDRDFVADLPFPGRLFSGTLALTPGVQGAGRGLPSGVHGSRGRGLAVISDGTPLDSDPLTTRFTNYLDSNAIDQLTLAPAGAGVAFGGAQGGFARIVQRDGSATFQGSASVLYGTSELDGSGAGAAAPLEPEFRSVDTAVQLSGPLVRDRLWYRLNWERVDREDPIDVLRGVEIQPTERDTHSHRLTLQASPRNRLAFQYQSAPLDIGLFGVDSSALPEAARRLETDVGMASVYWTATPSATLLVQSSVTLHRRDGRVGPAIGGIPNDCITGVESLANGFCVPQVADTSGSHYLSVNSESEGLTLASGVTWDSGRGGWASHQLRFGFEVESGSLDETYQQRAVLRPDPDAFQFFDATLAVPSRTAAPVDSQEWAIYFEDRFKPHKRLTITVGARVERQELETLGFGPFDPRDEFGRFVELAGTGDPFLALRQAFTAFDDLDGLVDGLATSLDVPESLILSVLPNSVRQSSFFENRRTPVSLNIVNTNISPAVALSWDPWGDGRTQVGVSGRRYFDRISPIHALEEARPTTIQSRFGVAGIPPTFAGFAGLLGAPSVRTVDHRLESPYQDEWRVFLTRELWPETSLRAEYIRRDYRKQLQDTDINHVAADFGRCRMASVASFDAITASPGAGFDLTDPFSGEVYTDTDPGDGDGRIDDCVGAIESVPVDFFLVRLQRPDGFADRYVQNPVWGEVIRTGNFNRSDYEAAVLEFIRRQHRGWGLNASYVWSRHRGAAENYEPFLPADPSELDDVPGTQSTEQEHEVRVAGSTSLPWALNIGAMVSWSSGLPYSIVERQTEFAATPLPFQALGARRDSRDVLRYPTGQRNELSNPSRWLVDLRLAKDFNLGRGVRGQLSLDVLNALDDDTLQIYNPDLEIGLRIDGVNHSRRDFGRRWQVGARLDF